MCSPSWAVRSVHTTSLLPRSALPSPSRGQCVSLRHTGAGGHTGRWEHGDSRGPGPVSWPLPPEPLTPTAGGLRARLPPLLGFLGPLPHPPLGLRISYLIVAGGAQSSSV